jgi:hypothetical protein
VTPCISRQPAAAPDPSLGRANLRIGLGLDLPTGEKDVTSYRTSSRDGRIVSTDTAQPVDQSNQPGDGGWGIPIDLYGYCQFTDALSTYLQASYLVTPETDNGLPTFRANPFEDVMSIGDVCSWSAPAWNGHSSGRMASRSDWDCAVKGQPAEELVGSSDWFRRPVMNMAFEPTLSWMKNRWNASLPVPVVFYNECFQSVPDRPWQAATGVSRHGDASSADYYVMLPIGRQF